MLKYENDGKYAYFNGVKFTRDEDTGYYLNSTIRQRLHRYIWEFHNGAIVDGNHIHHIDKDKSNNNLSNLTSISEKEHLLIHGVDNFINNQDWAIRFQSKGVESAKAWHRSDKGREWHKKQYENTKDRLHEVLTFTCEFCGKEYEGVDNGKNRFCSGNCKSKWRRREGVDNVVRQCQNCNKKFTVNKYSKRITCDRKCFNAIK